MPCMKGFFIKSKTYVFHQGEKIIGNNSLAMTYLSQSSICLSHDAMKKRVCNIFGFFFFGPPSFHFKHKRSECTATVMFN